MSAPTNTNPFAAPRLRADRRAPLAAAAAAAAAASPRAVPAPSTGRPARQTDAPVYMNSDDADAFLWSLSASNPFSSRPGSPTGSPGRASPTTAAAAADPQCDAAEGEQHYENVASPHSNVADSADYENAEMIPPPQSLQASYENAEMIDSMLDDQQMTPQTGRIAASNSGNPFEVRGASDTAHDPAAEEYYKNLSLASGSDNPFDGLSGDDDDNDDYEEMLAVFMRENGQRAATPPTAPRDPFAPAIPDRNGGNGDPGDVYDVVTEIGGISYGSFYPVTKGLSKMEVGENMSQSRAEAQLKNAPAGGFLLRRNGGAVTLSMADPAGKVHHIAIKSHGNGDRLSIPPSLFHAANLEELVLHYVREAKNDVLPCHLTVHMLPPTSADGGGGGGGDIKHGGATAAGGAGGGDDAGLAGNAIMTAIPREFQARQKQLLHATDYDSPRCLRCGTKFGSWSGKKRELCHCCGVAVCGDCSSERLKHSPHVRLCSMCYKDNKDNASIKTTLRPVPELVAAGLLTKSDKKKRSWKERFFTLDSNGVLHYYTIKKEKRARRAYSAADSVVGAKPDAAPGSSVSAEEKAALASPIGDVAGAINIKDSCTRVVVEPGISEWPAQSGAGTRFAVETDERTFYFFAMNAVHAHKWRAVLTLTAGCCYGCGEKLFADGEGVKGGKGADQGGMSHSVGTEGGVVGIAVGAAGLLYHPRCYVCTDCNGTVQGEPAVAAPTAAAATPPAAAARADVVGDVLLSRYKRQNAAAEPLSLLGASLYCDRHLPNPASRQPHELELVEFRSMVCQTLAADGVRGFMHEQVQRYAQLAMAIAGKQKQEEVAAAAAAMKSMPPAGAGGKGKGKALANKASHQITDQERIMVLERVKRGELTMEQAEAAIEQAIKRVQSKAADLRTEASVAMSRCAAHGVNIFCQEAQRPTKLSETWEATDDGSATIAEWTVLKSDTWTATVIDRAGAIPLNVTAFQPAMFERIRQISGIDETEYQASFDPTKIGAANMVSGGSSGCWVVRTHDSKFIIKNCRGDEKDVLLKVMAEYTAYVESQPGSLLTRYLGAYDFRMGGGKAFTAVVMTNSMHNAYCSEHGLKFDSVYDLKGSIVGRRSVKASMRNSTAENTVESFSGTMKDMDLRRTIMLQPDDRRFIVKQLEADAKFLAARQLMDYSLIVAIHNCSPATTLQHATGVVAAEAAAEAAVANGTSNGDGTGAAGAAAGFSNKAYVGKGVEAGTQSVYVFGIIDLLQKWGRGKVAENFAKSKVLRQDKHAISAVKPDEYAERFVTMLSGRFADYVD